MTRESRGAGKGQPPGRAAARGPAGPEPVESADVQEAGLSEPGRAALSASLGVILGTVLAELGRLARRRTGASKR